MTIAEQLARAKADYDEVYQAGKKSEYDRFWDEYQQNGQRLDYNYAFYGNGWDDSSYTPKYPIKASYTACRSLFAWSIITDTCVLIDLTIAKEMQSTFYQCQYLKTIREIIITEDTTINLAVFYNCNVLENLTFTGVIGATFSLQWSTKLTKASITSIVNALSTTTSGLSVTLSKTAVNKAFKTSVGANDGSTSTEWTTLIATKSNWTISLV